MGIFKMHIFVKTLTGKSLELDVEPSSQIFEINNQIESLIGVPSEEQILINNGKNLSGSLIDCGLEEESQIYMVVDIEEEKKRKRRNKLPKKRRSTLEERLSSLY